MENEDLMSEDISEPARRYDNDRKHKDNCGWTTGERECDKERLGRF